MQKMNLKHFEWFEMYSKTLALVHLLLQPCKSQNLQRMMLMICWVLSRATTVLRLMFVKSLLVLLMGLDSTNSNPDMEQPLCVDLHRFTATRSVSLQTTVFSFQNPLRRVHISLNCVANEAYLLCSCRTLLDSWSVRPTKLVASQRTERNSSLQYRA